MMKLTIVLTGSEKNELTLEAAEALKTADARVLHTGYCGAAEWLKENGLAFETLDSLYTQAEDFDEHINKATEYILSLDAERVCACFMNAQDETAKKLLELKPDARVIGDGLMLRARGGVLSVSALDISEALLSPINAVIVREIDTRTLAGECKLKLMEIYGDEAKAYIRQPEGGIAYCGLENLDRLRSYDHRCACLVNPQGGVDFEVLLRKGRTLSGGRNDIDTTELSRRMAELIQDICAGERFGCLTAAEIFEETAEVFDYEQN